jgi:hypothetical protein
MEERLWGRAHAVGENAGEHTHTCRGTSEGPAAAISDCGTHTSDFGLLTHRRFVRLSQHRKVAIHSRARSVFEHDSKLLCFHKLSSQVHVR